MFNALARPSGTRLASSLPAQIPEPRVDLLANVASEDQHGEPVGPYVLSFHTAGQSDRPLGILGTCKQNLAQAMRSGNSVVWNGLREARGHRRAVSPLVGSDARTPVLLTIMCVDVPLS